MSTNFYKTYAPAVLRRCLFTILSIAFTSVLLYSTSYAKECEEGQCKAVKVLNYTDYAFKIQFLLCCDGEYKETECEEVPLEGTSFDFPDGCTMLKFGFCSRLPRGVCAKWYDDECVIRIVYCSN